MSARDFDPHISVERISHAKDGDYFIKKIEVEHLRRKIETPFKILAGNGINEQDIHSISDLPSQPFLEYQKFVSSIRSWVALHTILTEKSSSERVQALESFFNIKKRTWESALTTVSLVFPKNPFVPFSAGSDEARKTFPGLDETSYICLLDYIHSASKAFVLCPDVRLEKRNDISPAGYLSFVDQSIKILHDRNSKPIFAPLHIELSKKNLEEVLTHYKAQGYSNIWINFDAKSCHGMYASRLRTIIHLIDKILENPDVTLYFSHIKKEILPNIQDDKVAASDILTQFHGADFIGTDREPWHLVRTDWNNDDEMREVASKHNFASTEEYKTAHAFHKHRIFDPDSYYYRNLDHYPMELPIASSTLLQDNAINQFMNSALMYFEVERTKGSIGEIQSVKKYLKGKEAFRENPGLMEDIVIQKPQSGLVDFLGNL
jgi:hypothetical protein